MKYVNMANEILIILILRQQTQNKIKTLKYS